MSGPAQTPASKRFKATQSSSASASKSASARKSQFLRTPQATASSPFTATPFRHQKVERDDIETSFEDEVQDAQLTTTNDALNQFQTSDMFDRDGVEDVADNSSSTSPTYREHLTNSKHNDQRLADGNRSSLRSPLPKRQKRTHHHNFHQPVMLVSSSPVEDATPILGDIGTAHEDLDGIEEVDSTDFVKEPIPISSRFLTPASTKHSLAVDQAKANFKGFLQQTATEGSTRSVVTLPDAFSPSKRRGKKDYVRGGVADTIRNHILQIANEQTQQASEDSMLIRMRLITADESGRFEVAEDIEGRTWMLVRQSDRPTPSALSNMVDSDGYVKICIRNPATTWPIELRDQAQLHIAVLWDVMQ